MRNDLFVKTVNLFQKKNNPLKWNSEFKKKLDMSIMLQLNGISSTFKETARENKPIPPAKLEAMFRENPDMFKEKPDEFKATKAILKHYQKVINKYNDGKLFQKIIFDDGSTFVNIPGLEQESLDRVKNRFKDVVKKYKHGVRMANSVKHERQGLNLLKDLRGEFDEMVGSKKFVEIFLKNQTRVGFEGVPKKRKRKKRGNILKGKHLRSVGHKRGKKRLKKISGVKLPPADLTRVKSLDRENTTKHQKKNSMGSLLLASIKKAGSIYDIDEKADITPVRKDYIKKFNDLQKLAKKSSRRRKNKSKKREVSSKTKNSSGLKLDSHLFEYNSPLKIVESSPKGVELRNKMARQSIQMYSAKFPEFGRGVNPSPLIPVGPKKVVALHPKLTLMTGQLKKMQKQTKNQIEKFFGQEQKKPDKIDVVAKKNEIERKMIKRRQSSPFANFNFGKKSLISHLNSLKPGMRPPGSKSPGIGQKIKFKLDNLRVETTQTPQKPEWEVKMDNIFEHPVQENPLEEEITAQRLSTNNSSLKVNLTNRSIFKSMTTIKKSTRRNEKSHQQNSQRRRFALVRSNTFNKGVMERGRRNRRDDSEDSEEDSIGTPLKRGKAGGRRHGRARHMGSTGSGGRTLNRGMSPRELAKMENSHFRKVKNFLTGLEKVYQKNKLDIIIDK